MSETMSLADLLAKSALGRAGSAREMARRLRALDEEHRSTMQGHCVACFDSDGYPVKWPCPDSVIMNGGERG